MCRPYRYDAARASLRAECEYLAGERDRLAGELAEERDRAEAAGARFYARVREREEEVAAQLRQAEDRRDRWWAPIVGCAEEARDAAQAREREAVALLTGLADALAHESYWTAPDGASMRHPVLIGKALHCFLASRSAPLPPQLDPEPCCEHGRPTGWGCLKCNQPKPFVACCFCDTPTTCETKGCSQRHISEANCTVAPPPQPGEGSACVCPFPRLECPACNFRCDACRQGYDEYRVRVDRGAAAKCPPCDGEGKNGLGDGEACIACGGTGRSPEASSPTPDVKLSPEFFTELARGDDE